MNKQVVGLYVEMYIVRACICAHMRVCVCVCMCVCVCVCNRESVNTTLPEIQYCC